jgi:hypothetical protein
MSRKLATATVLLLLLVMAGAPAGANAASKDQAHSDLSSLPKIEAYLNSIGIDLGSVVVQQGHLNYAGPNCPGAGWNCTTANKVVQLGSATQPSTNVVDCTPAVSVTLLGLDECVIIQSSVTSLTETASTTNSASCDIQSPSGNAKQKCKTKQSSRKGSNHAVVRQQITQHGGSPQTAQEEASIEQTSETGNNTAKITQTVKQTLNTHETAAVTQTQNARQHATVEQTSMTGYNSSDVQQYQYQDENAGSQASIDQEQNTDSLIGRNVQAEVTQTSTTGNTTSSLRQLITQHQDGDTPAGCTLLCSVNQTQSNFDGGLEGSVTQTTNDPGVARSESTQDELQTQEADTDGLLTQTQEGPEFCCATQIGGTPANFNRVAQSNVQQNDTGAGQTTVQHGKCSTTGGGNCTASQTYTSNSGTTQDSETAPAVTCSGSGEGNFCSPFVGE